MPSRAVTWPKRLTRLSRTRLIAGSLYGRVASLARADGHGRAWRSGPSGPSRGGGCRPELQPAVGVEAAEPERARVGDQDHHEPEDEEERGGAASPGALVAGVEVDRVDEPGDERRRLLRVPAPV